MLRLTALALAFTGLTVVPAALCPAAAGNGVRVMALLASAQTRGECGDLAGALSVAAQAAAIAPDHPQVQATLALLHQRRGDSGQAAEHYVRFQLLSLQARGCGDDERTRQIAEAEAMLVLMANAERCSRGLPALLPDPRLTEMARRHSEEMRDLDYFSHLSPVRHNEDIGERFLRTFGRPAVALAENISRMTGTLWSLTPENLRDSHTRLMLSSGHRANILWDRPRSIGVGVAVNARGDYWITENFALIDE